MQLEYEQQTLRDQIRQLRLSNALQIFELSKCFFLL